MDDPAGDPHRGERPGGPVNASSGFGWLAIFAALLVWEGIGLTRNRDGWYTVSDLLRLVTANRVGRWLLFAAWLWVGWHLFIRGWRFFLGSLPAQGPAPASPGPTQSASQLLRTDVAPMMGTFALMAVAVRFWYRARRRNQPVVRPTTRRRWLIEDVAGTMVGGYVLFLALDGLYYALVAGQRRTFVSQAVTGGAFLAFVAAPGGFALAGALAEGIRRLHHPARPP